MQNETVMQFVTLGIKKPTNRLFSIYCGVAMSAKTKSNFKLTKRIIVDIHESDVSIGENKFRKRLLVFMKHYVW